MSAPEILSTGSCVPTQVVTNEMLAQRVDTSDEWVFSRTGIHSRRHCSGGENGVAMAAQAALRWVHTGIQARTGELRDEAAALEHQNSELEDKIGELGSVKSVEDIARSELGLADPNTLILDLQPQS